MSSRIAAAALTTLCIAAIGCGPAVVIARRTIRISHYCIHCSRAFEQCETILVRLAARDWKLLTASYRAVTELDEGRVSSSIVLCISNASLRLLEVPQSAVWLRSCEEWAAAAFLAGCTTCSCDPLCRPGYESLQPQGRSDVHNRPVA